MSQKDEAARSSRSEDFTQPQSANLSTEPGQRPHVAILIGIEERPSVRVRCQNEGEELRIRDWIQRNPPLRRIVRAALQLRDAA